MWSSLITQNMLDRKKESRSLHPLHTANVFGCNTWNQVENQHGVGKSITCPYPFISDALQ